MGESVIERLRGLQDELDAARTVRPKRIGSEQLAVDTAAGNALPKLLAVVEAAEANLLAWEQQCAEIAPDKDPWEMATPESRVLVQALAALHDEQAEEEG